MTVASLAAARVAAASPESEALFRQGRALLKADKLAEACEAFAQSQTLAPGVGALLNLGDCRERQGRTATAWSLFREARTLASQTNDRREVEAARRAASLEPTLAYLTVTIAPDRRVEGLVLKRNGTVVDPALWNQPVPLDPGDYVIEGTAPAYEPWSTTESLAPRARVSLVIELVAESEAVAVVSLVPKHDAEPGSPGAPSASFVPGRQDDVAEPSLPRSGPTPRLRPYAIGLAFGTSDGDDSLVGGRILRSFAVRGGAVRAIGSMLYTKTQFERYNYLDDASNTTSVYGFGLAADYVWMPRPRLGFAGGVGLGVDHYRLSLGGTETNRSVALRASPIIVRLMEGHVELGLHVQLVRTNDNLLPVKFAALAAIDVFPL